MRLKRKLLLLFSIALLSTGFVLTANAASVQFSKKYVRLNKGQSKIVTVKNAGGDLEVQNYSSDNGVFTYQVINSSKIRITAKKPGISSLTVSSKGRFASIWVTVMPGENKQVKEKTVAQGTKISYKKVSVILPKKWKSSNFLYLTTKNSISFHSKSSFKVGYSGRLFTIHWCKAKKWEQLKGYLPSFRFLTRKGNTVYYMTEPTDVQFCPDKPKYQKQYRALYDTVDEVIRTFQIKK